MASVAGRVATQSALGRLLWLYLARNALVVATVIGVCAVGLRYKQGQPWLSWEAVRAGLPWWLGIGAVASGWLASLAVRQAANRLGIVLPASAYANDSSDDDDDDDWRRRRDDDDDRRRRRDDDDRLQRDNDDYRRRAEE